eukprot:COSAG01_NODE_1567_length_9877_cov_8.690939_5_plen_226_part_00
MRPLRTSPCTLGPPPPRTVPSAPSPAPAASPSGPAVCEPAVVHERHCCCVRLVAHLVIPRRSGVSNRSTPHKRTAPLHLDPSAYQCEVLVAEAPGPGRLVTSRDDVSLPPQPTTQYPPQGKGTCTQPVHVPRAASSQNEQLRGWLPMCPPTCCHLGRCARLGRWSRSPRARWPTPRNSPRSVSRLSTTFCPNLPLHHLVRSMGKKQGSIDATMAIGTSAGRSKCM